MDLSLRFDENGTMHNDITLQFAGLSWTCDSYYLALDEGIFPHRQDAAKVRAVLKRLLDQWLSAVDNLRENDSVYLPYDFSDQYTGWLRCSRSGEWAEVRRGWANLEGWAVLPSAVGHYLTDLPGFLPDGPALRSSISELTGAVRDLMLPNA